MNFLFVIPKTVQFVQLVQVEVFTIKDYQSRKAIPTNINEKLIVDTLSSMPIVGNSEGMIPAFGVFLTRHFANYYNYIVYKTEQAIKNATGDESLAANLFIEAGHVCAFSTFGGIMKSDEWYGLVYPQIKTREDWISGIIAVANSLGWGIWSVKELVPEKKLVIEAFGDYESNAYLSCYGTSSIPKSYLVTGGAAGLMNLMYHLDITTKPILDEETYSKLFQTPGFFEAKQIKCRTMGDDRCEIVVEREG